MQTGLSEPAALLLNEPSQVLAVAAAAGYRTFTDAEAFKAYVRDLVGLEATAV